MTERPDEISSSAAAALLGVTPRRLRQLAEGGFLTIHRRGFTTVGSAISGYIRALRAEGHATEVSASAARGHTAKAALIRAATAKRRATLTAVSEAEQAIATVAEAAIRRLGEARLPASVPTHAGISFRAEIAAAIDRIRAAETRALAALTSGESSALDGGNNG